MNGLIARKQGMTEVYDAEGRRVAVTVLEAGPCVVVQRKTADKDGYDAVQVGFGDKRERCVGKAAMGRFRKAGVSAKRVLREFKVSADYAGKPGDAINVSLFDGVSHVDVVGVTKGRGFQGVVKRWRMGGGPATHGHTSHRRIGAIGQREKPGRVAKDHHMPGHMGNVRVTQQNLRVVQVRPDDNVLLVQGAIPGPTGAIVVVRKALKRK
jgi:large subunit ribosomal protein L3